MEYQFEMLRLAKNMTIPQQGRASGPNTQIPWANPDEWNQVLLSIKTVEKNHPKDCEVLKKLALDIHQRYNVLNDVIEKICLKTCINCTDVCCVRASLWFDFKDLLYVYFGQQDFPEYQIYKALPINDQAINDQTENNKAKNQQGNQKSGCCHLSKQGCKLPRTSRPFICTWYFCSAQKDYLLNNKENMPGNIKAQIDESMLEIKSFRNKLEDLFIESASGSV